VATRLDAPRLAMMFYLLGDRDCWQRLPILRRLTRRSPSVERLSVSSARGYTMDDTAGGRPPCQQPVPVLNGLSLTISRRAGGAVPARVMAGIQASLLLLLLVGCATPDWRGHNQLERARQDLVAAHPEWPPEILGAVASGVICAGMTPDMVRAAWGHPIRISSDGSELNPRNIWHYAGRQHNADMMGAQGSGAQPSAEWTVAFTHGGVIGWTE
jgi:hypothetical protein